MLIVAHLDGWSLADGPRGRRWLLDTAVARHGLAGAYARWTRITKVGNRWLTCDDRGPTSRRS